MGIFGEAKRKHSSDWTDEERADYRKKLEVCKAEAVALAEVDLPSKEATEAACIAEYREDVATHAVTCVRVGDFLNLKITRLSAVTPSIIDADDRKFRPVTSDININLSLVTAIAGTTGKPPGNEGQITWGFNYEYFDASGKKTGWGSSSSLGLPSKNSKMVAYANVPKVEYTKGKRPSYVLPHKNDQQGWGNGMHQDDGQYFPPKPFPVPAKDDAINFSGLGSTLYVPYGKAPEVLKTIMEAIGAKQ